MFRSFFRRQHHEAELDRELLVLAEVVGNFEYLVPDVRENVSR